MAHKFVNYVSTKGTNKAALVVMDETETHDEFESPAPGHAHLLVFDLRGLSSRFNVPSKETAEAKAAEAGDLSEQPELRGYFVS